MLPFVLYLFIAVLSSRSTQVSSVQTFKLGVPLISSAGTPYDIERIGPAIDIAIERVNRDILNGSYQLVTIEKPYGKFCSGSTAPGIVADLVKDHAIIGLVGPACAYALDPTAKLANYWNIPIVTGFGDGGLFKNKTEYPTLTRLAYCQCRLRKVFGSIFIEFKWTDIAIIYDINDLYSRVLGTTLQTGFQKQQIFPKMFSYYGRQNTSYQDILLQVRKVARVILLIVPGDSLREFMLDAFDLGLIQSGEYVFMDVWLFPFPGQYWGDHDWLRNDLRDQDAKVAYESLLRISLQVPTSVEWTNFTNDVKILALSKYGFNFTNEEVNFFIGAFHDAVILFGMALNESLEAGILTGNIDGYNFTRNMWDRIFNGITGQVIIDDNGDRDTSYSILDMDPVTGKFQVVANFFGDRQYYNPVPGKYVHWAGGRTTPPLNEPFCWYEGDNPECDISEKANMYAVIFSSMVVLFIMAFSVLLYRHKKHEKDILNDSWRVKYDELEFNYNNVTASCYSMVTANTNISDKSSKHHPSGNGFINVANYMGEVVYVRKVKKQKINVTRKVLIEIQQVRSFHHENLSRFVGACVEPSRILILYEYCRKGTLEVFEELAILPNLGPEDLLKYRKGEADLLCNDAIKLDWTFRLSLLKDIAKGMKYLHSSALKYHGSLRSSNCVVDGRFVVKISDFGLQSFSDDIVVESEKSRKMYQKLWVAPEHLRYPSLVDGSRKGDVFSFGIIIQEVITRSPPYDCCNEVIDTVDIIARVASKEKPPYRPNFSSDDCPIRLHKLMVMCWTEDPEDRPEFPAVLKQIRKQTGGSEDDLIDSLLRRMERYTLNLEDIVQERTHQLAAEKKRSDELLYQILPQSVATELRLGKFVTPEWFDCVTIYFSDIVGFTELSGSSSPMEVISLLNDLYSNFDSIIETFDVYKVETIGDAYMVVSGLPIRNGSDHAAAICKLSLKLLQQIQNFVIRHRPDQKLRLRIGIHTGPCVAGVVGLKMPRYCLFGDTVNVASRMESSGDACKIHISSNTKEILDRIGNFDVEERGQINIKGKGVMTTYWLKAEKKTTAESSISRTDLDS